MRIPCRIVIADLGMWLVWLILSIKSSICLMSFL